MARFLIATQPITGHMLPALPLARTLVQRGHDVRWYAGVKFKDLIEVTGAGFEPYRAAYDYDDRDWDAAFPGRSSLKGLNQIKYDFIHVFMQQVGPQHRDLAAILREFPADVLVADPSVGAAATLNEQGGPPFAVYNISCLGIKSRDTAPFGLGILPSRSPFGRLRNNLLYFLASNIIFKSVSAELSRQCASLGLPPRKFVGVVLSPYLLLEPTVPGFEYPRRDLPPQVHFIGALLPDQAPDFVPPDWWSEIVAKDRPVVLVTQGTVATDARELIAPTLAGLAREQVLVIAAGVPSIGSLGLERVPDNARVEAFVPFAHLLPHVDVYVTNGGFGGVHAALSHGVPIVVGGTTEDKPEISNRVAYSGVGINLKTNTPTAEQVRQAVTQVLQEPGYRRKARQLQAELAAHDAPAEAAVLLERLATTKQPVIAQQGIAHSPAMLRA